LDGEPDAVLDQETTRVDQPVDHTRRDVECCLNGAREPAQNRSAATGHMARLKVPECVEHGGDGVVHPSFEAGADVHDLLANVDESGFAAGGTEETGLCGRHRGDGVRGIRADQRSRKRSCISRVETSTRSASACTFRSRTDVDATLCSEAEATVEPDAVDAGVLAVEPVEQDETQIIDAPTTHIEADRNRVDRTFEPRPNRECELARPQRLIAIVETRGIDDSAAPPHGRSGSAPDQRGRGATTLDMSPESMGMRAPLHIAHDALPSR
jgi:hypothetical protein